MTASLFQDVSKDLSFKKSEHGKSMTYAGDFGKNGGFRGVLELVRN